MEMEKKTKSWKTEVSITWNTLVGYYLIALVLGVFLLTAFIAGYLFNLLYLTSVYGLQVRHKTSCETFISLKPLLSHSYYLGTTISQDIKATEMHASSQVIGNFLIQDI